MSSPFAQPRILENFRLDLRSLRDDTHHSNDRPAWERLFDVICPGPEIPAGHVNDRNANILTSFQVSLGFLNEGYIHLTSLLSDSVDT